MLVRVNGEGIDIREAIQKVKELLDADLSALVKIEGVDSHSQQSILTNLCILYEQEGRYTPGILGGNPKPFRTQNHTLNSVEYTNAPK